MICSITSSGLLMPSDQHAFQTPSILLFNSPVITALTNLTAAGYTRQRLSAMVGSRRRRPGRAPHPSRSESLGRSTQALVPPVGVGSSRIRSTARRRLSLMAEADSTLQRVLANSLMRWT